MHATTFDFNDRILNLISTIFVRLLENRIGITLYQEDPLKQKLLMSREEAYKAVAELGYELGDYSPSNAPRAA